MATDGGSYGEYDPAIRSGLLAEAVRVVRSFSFAGAHVVVVGGLVPSLLVPQPEAGLEPHVGTNDLDLCLRMALVDGDVGSYERLETSLKVAGFVMMSGVSWRWKGGVSLPLTVEFFCPPKEGREIGRLYRPGGVVGGKLSAVVLAMGGLVDLDARDIEVEVNLPGDGGKTRQPLKVVGPAGYLAAKADALRRRNKPKDAYDIVWLAECWPGGQAGLAPVIRESSIFNDPLFKDSLRTLRQEFADIEAEGAKKYARFFNGSGRDMDQLARRAVGAIQQLLQELTAFMQVG
ncbi:nucleotidyl transferase AbiEii/AbiGii toxin family protein [Myxococcus sp. AM010]|uniref:nucleotidyl transferase AbiEii/AbiGii toxin family protein n=1 Tax=Myxococcus sp. AM010 TaxID=2745138 RepID=UPI001595DAF9|nr:nucleotidyl transferase AbiEii/AbiGii toxin family protein [Myxococcus sp. AM010]NVJ17450.1 nucleotidyl transferase AbiEii/AbiGii toxin family protein [Myxococcus sp. AM010]